MLELNDEAIMLAVFDGFNDPGTGAAIAVEHLLDICPSKQIAKISADNFIDLRRIRPEIAITKNKKRVLNWPDTKIHLVWLDQFSNKNTRLMPIILIHGVEPNYHWKKYISSILKQADKYGITKIITMGSILADVPHTREMDISLTKNGIGDPFGDEYQGVTGILGALSYYAHAQGIETQSIWVTTPHYLPQYPSPKAAIALIRKLEEILDITIPTKGLTELVKSWENLVDDMLEDTNIDEYIEKLETDKDIKDLENVTGDSIVKEFEYYLRHLNENSEDETIN